MYLEPKWPLFLKGFHPPKQGLFIQPKQGAPFGFQVGKYTISIPFLNVRIPFYPDTILSPLAGQGMVWNSLKSRKACRHFQLKKVLRGKSSKIYYIDYTWRFNLLIILMCLRFWLCFWKYRWKLSAQNLISLKLLFFWMNLGSTSLKHIISSQYIYIYSIIHE